MKEIKLFISIFIMIISLKGTFSLDDLEFEPISVIREKRTNLINKETPPFDFIDLVEQYGYPAEAHGTQTEDLYNLRIHRVPGSPARPKAPRKPVVYIHHGIFGLSNMFVLGGPDKDLVFLLADAGYDVWLGNSRGSTYSRSHAKFHPDRDPEYWNFSFHEIAVYDMTATIDYILEETNSLSLIYVGHSMSTTMIYVLLSMRPEYEQKIDVVVNMASIANWVKPGAFVTFLKNNGETIKGIVRLLGINELFPHRASYCEEGIFRMLCVRLLRAMNGYNSTMDSNVLVNSFPYMPAGCSSKTTVHYHQNLVAGKLRMFDYGSTRNFAIYGSMQPPAYNLQNITTHIYMFYGKGDTIADPEDTLDLLNYLKFAWAISVDDENFSHLDFLWGKNIRTMLNDRVFQVIQRYTRI